MRFQSVIDGDVQSPYKAAEMRTNTQANIKYEVDVSDAIVTGYGL